MAALEKMRQDYRQVAEFLIVYIKEAHTEDEWPMESNTEEGVRYNQPKSFEDRLQLAQTFVKEMGVETTTFVDDIRNTANACYAAWPERLYVIDTGGTIVYKGGMGPFGFKPDELRGFLEKRYAAPSS